MCIGYTWTGNPGVCGAYSLRRRLKAVPHGQTAAGFFLVCTKSGERENADEKRRDKARAGEEGKKDRASCPGLDL